MDPCSFLCVFISMYLSADMTNQKVALLMEAQPTRWLLLAYQRSPSTSMSGNKRKCFGRQGGKYPSYYPSFSTASGFVPPLCTCTLCTVCGCLHSAVVLLLVSHHIQYLTDASSAWFLACGFCTPAPLTPNGCFTCS